MDADLPQVLLALAPIAVVLILLSLRVPSIWAAAAGLGTALLAGLTVFTPTAQTVMATGTQMGPMVVVVALILLGGLGIAEAMSRSGGQDAIAEWLQAAESGGDRTATLLLLIYGLTPFMESVTGFGIGVVITAPLLVRHGLSPVQAITAGLLGLVLVPWGSLAPGTLVASQLGGQDFHALGIWSAVLTAPVLIVSMGSVLWLIGRRPTARHLGLAAGVVLVQWAALLLASLIAGPPLAGVLASVAVIGFMLALVRISRGGLPTVTARLRQAAVPYVVLIGGILTSTAALALAGGPAGWGWLSNPALWLLIAALLAPVALGVARPARPALARRVLRRWVPVAANAVLFMVLGIVIAATGMAEYLAVTAAQLGPGFVAAIPALGALGGYLTGSNTGAAAMFSTASTTAATGLGASPMIALAAQNVAGSFAIIASPPRIVLAAAVVLPAGAKVPARTIRLLVAAVAVTAAILGVLTVLLA